MRLFNSAAAAAALLVGLAAGDAAAHVTANPNQAPADSWFRTALRVSHGCEGTPTVAVRVKMPEGVLSVRPQMKPGWEISITKRKLDEPIEGPHETVTEVVDEVAWRGGGWEVAAGAGYGRGRDGGYERASASLSLRLIP